MRDGTFDYEGAVIRLAPFPNAERIGAWWRRRWHFVLTQGSWESRILPPPVIESRDVAMVVTAVCLSSSELVIEAFTVDEMMTGDELTYVTIVAAWFAHLYPPEVILVEGMPGHPLLEMSKLSPDVIAMLEQAGY